MSYTKALAEYATKLRYEDIPKEVIEQAKLLTLHTLGVSLAGSSTKQGKDAIALAKVLGGGKQEATLIGDGTKVSCAEAGFANSTLADVLDWEDCSWTGHPSAGAIPAGLAVGETVKASGKDYITSVVAGYEVYQRIAMAVQPSREYWASKGWGLVNWQIFSGAIPAAKLLRLNEEKMAQTIGIAGVLTPIVTTIKCRESYSNIYHYQHGCSCRDSIVAAFIAKSGISGLYDILDGDHGYWSTLSDKCDWEWLTKGLGTDYLIMETLFKHWPANMWIQQYLDAVDVIVRENKIGADDVEEVIVAPNYLRFMYHRPEGFDQILRAQFSIPYCIAVRLLDPEPGPQWYTDEKLRNPKLLRLASRVRAEGASIKAVYETFKMFKEGKYPEVKVTIITRDGKHYSNTNSFPKGHPKNRMTYDEYTERFKRAASFGLKPDRIDQAMERIYKLDKLGDVSLISELMHN